MIFSLHKFNTALLLSLLCLSGTVFSASLNNEERKQLKQELINELLQSDALKEKIQEQILASKKQKLLNSVKSQQNKRNALHSKIKKTLRPINPNTEHIYGNPNAPISIIEFSDFECPYCRKIHPTLKQLVNTSNNQVNWIFRHFPMSFHQPNASREAAAAECAGKQMGGDTFWRFTDALFLQPRRGNTDRDLIIKNAALRSGVSFESLISCIAAGTFSKKVKSDEQEALALGLRGTPANILIHHSTGKILLRQGSASLQTLQKDIASLLKVKK